MAFLDDMKGFILISLLVVVGVLGAILWVAFILVLCPLVLISSLATIFAVVWRDC